MSDPNRCERCGGPLQAGPLGGACARCMMELGVESASGNPEDPDSTLAASRQAPQELGITSRPTVIGRYRILRLIGEGGMGAVYEAEQDHPRRIVALKIIKPGIASPELLRRFEQESHALGRLQHPGIAHIYEAGTADTGFGPQPYFAMEFIRGKTLKDYAEEQHLNTRQRLEMVSKIAEAVQHAHQRGLIHRDLKPVNIMIDETGQPKILDFGVARATDSDSQATSQTDIGQLVGTLAYMSPEQVLADPLELDTRSDVYALGVILYELLAGRLPYTISKKLHETIHAIREEDPVKLSSINRSYRGDIETIAAKALEKDKTRRYGSAAELATDIQRYLHDEPIVARPPSTGYQLQKFARRHKALVAGIAAVFVVLAGGVVTSTWQAMRANRERDRATAAEQAAETDRDKALSEEQVANDARRQAIAAGEQARSERDTAISERQRADTETSKATALFEFFVNDVLAMSDPLAQLRTGQVGKAGESSEPNPNLTVKEALDASAKRIQGRFANQPLLEADLHWKFAGIYAALNEYAHTQDQLELAIVLWRRELGEKDPATLKGMSSLAATHRIRGSAAARNLWGQVFEGYRSTVGYDDPGTQTAIAGMVSVLRVGARVNAELFLQDVITAERRALGTSHPHTLNAVRLLVDIYLEPGGQFGDRRNDAEAEALLKRLLAEERRKLIKGKNNPATLTATNLLARVYLTQDRYKEAEDLLSPLTVDSLVTKVLSGGPTVLKEHASTLESMGLLAEAYTKQGKTLDAQAVNARAVKIAETAFGGGLPDLFGAINVVTTLIEKITRTKQNISEDRLADADNLVKEILESYRRMIGARDPATDAVTGMLILVAKEFVIKGKAENAEKLLTSLVDIHRSALGEDDPATTSVMAAAAGVYRTHGNYEKTEQMLTALWEQTKRLGETHEKARFALSDLADVYYEDGRSKETLGQSDEARRRFAKAEDLLNQYLRLSLRVSKDSEVAETRTIRNRLAQVFVSEGKFEEAEKQLNTALESQRTMPGNPQQIRRLINQIGWVRIQRHRYPEAEGGLRELLSFFDRGGPESLVHYVWATNFGVSLLAQKKYVDAEPWLLRGYTGMAGLPPNVRAAADNVARFTLEETGDWIVRLYEDWGKPAEAAEWRTKLRAADISGSRR